MFSDRLLIDRLATLEPRTGLTRVSLSNDASCKKKEIDGVILREGDQFVFHFITVTALM